MRLTHPAPVFAALAVVLVGLALMRPVDHDESQYVAAAVLGAEGLLPYRDYAYLQTPLQPFVVAPLAWAAGGMAWPALRIANALLALIAVVASWRAMRTGGADPAIAIACAGLFAACDILLFAAGTARNDALPAALSAIALIPMLRAERDGATPGSAMLVGLLLAAAAATKISYALPAAAYGLYALVHRGHRPGWVVAGAAPVIAFVGWTCTLDPAGFMFGTMIFPHAAPDQYYRAIGRVWKLSLAGKAVDMLKFLALGPALIALAAVVRGVRRPCLLDWLILAGLIAAVLPTPTWRQYLLPLLPPLFVRLALLWTERPPARGWRIAAAVFAGAGLMPSVAASGSTNGMGPAMREARAVQRAMDVAGVAGPVATLAPQILPTAGRAIDPRFAAGPFYFRSEGLADPAREQALGVVSHGFLDAHFANGPPAAILVGSEGRTMPRIGSLDAVMERWAVRHRWRAIRVAGTRFRLYVPPQAAARARSAISAE